jgi:hypothetical protein
VEQHVAGAERALDGGDHAFGLVTAGGHLAPAESAVAKHDHICEGAPDVHPDKTGHPISLAGLWL